MRRRSPHPFARAHAVLAALATTAALLAASTTAASATDPDGPDYQQPSVGECRDLPAAAAAAASDPTAPVDCGESHTVRVVAVGQLPEGATWQDPDAALARIAVRTCQPAVDAALGRTAATRDRSAYSWLWFTPTKAQRSHGARWIRCDLDLVGGSRLLRLPTDATPALGRRLPDTVARCLVARSFVTTTCAHAHAFRATGTFPLDGKRYPSAAAFRHAALKACPSRVSGTRFRWTYRGKDAWRLGDHVVVCYSRTRG